MIRQTYTHWLKFSSITNIVLSVDSVVSQNQMLNLEELET